MTQHRARLTPREQAFVDHFFGKARANATRAAILAGYSPRSARNIAWRLMTKAHIQRAVSRRVQRREQHTDLTNEYIDSQVRKLAERGHDEKTRLGAWKELNKVRGRHRVSVNVRDKTYEELIAKSREESDARE